MTRLLSSLVSFLLSASFLAAAVPPATPSILEPEADGQLVSGADVHMVTAPFADADGHRHRCTDWEILSAGEVVWEARCVTDSGKIHIHMADGVFVGLPAERRELPGGAPYTLRARHRDDSGDPGTEWSAWSARTFNTSIPPPARPMVLRDVLPSPSPRWSIVPPAGLAMRLEAVDGDALLEMDSSAVRDAPELAAPSAVRLVLRAAGAAVTLAESELAFEDENGKPHTIYLPATEVRSGGSAAFWVSANGGTHHADTDGRSPDFESIARGAPVPWTARQQGFTVERVATGLQLPVNLAFVTDPGPGPDAPLFYVAELYGNVKVVTRAGDVRNFATNLLDIQPTGHFPGNGESGVAGIVVDPASGDVFVTAVYWPDRSVWSLAPRVLRLRASDDGLHAEAVETVVAFPKETQSPSHQISNITIGPDGKLYVHVGDAAEHETAQDMTTIRGKILRMNLDGAPPADNPFYDAANGLDPADYVFALGLRNPFGGAWRAANQSLYCVENGPVTDRLSKIVAGRNYLWDGTDASMQNFAVHTWRSPTAPVQIAFVQPETLGGSGFPPRKQGAAYVTESGVTWASGPQEWGKRITEVVLQGETLARAPVPLVEYDGTGKATAAGVAAGPDGLYFTDLYKDYGYTSAIDRGASVYRIRWTGYAAFRARTRTADGLTIDLTDTSDVAEATAWTWDFGDGQSSSERNPEHRYARDGVYLVRLAVAGAEGTLTQTKKIAVGAGSAALSGEYFAGPDLTEAVVVRSESELDFDWGAGSPAPALPADSFSARWSGNLRPRFSESYRLTVRSTDRVRLRIGGVVLIDHWTAPVPGERSAEIFLEAGRDYPLVVEYRHDSGEAALQVFWESETQGRLPVPHSFSLPRRRTVRP